MTDRESIVELAARFADALTQGDLAAFAAVWSPDSVWVVDPPLGVTMQGDGQVMADAVAGMSAYWESFVQLVHHSRVELDGDRATSRTYLTEHGVTRDGKGRTIRGFYDDELVRTAQGWRYATRHFRFQHADDEPIPGLTAGHG